MDYMAGRVASLRTQLQTMVREMMKSKDGMKGMALGQVLSLLITGTAFTSSVLARRGIDAPTTQSLLNYVLLATVYGCILIIRRKQVQIVWWVYLLLATIDVEANYLAVKAYQFTSITSVMLLDCWSIPCVLVLTWLALKTRYSNGHFVGVSVCVAGLLFVIFSDVHAKDRSGGSNVILGDMLVVGASLLYAISNVSEEFVVKKVDPVEFLAHLGCFGALISVCQLYILEWHEVRSIRWTAGAILPFLGFAFSCFAFSTLVPILLQRNGSAMLNLSLLTSDMWAVAIRALAFHELVDGLYFIAFGIVAGGLVVYALSGDPSPAPETGLTAARDTYKQIKQVEMSGDQTDATSLDEGGPEEELSSLTTPKSKVGDAKV